MREPGARGPADSSRRSLLPRCPACACVPGTVSVQPLSSVEPKHTPGSQGAAGAPSSERPGTRGSCPGGPRANSGRGGPAWVPAHRSFCPRAGSTCLGTLPTCTARRPTLQGDSPVVIVSVPGHGKVQRRDLGGPAVHAAQPGARRRGPPGLINLQVEAPLLQPQAH